MENIVVVSPDHGGTTRARRLADALGAPIAIIDKRRPRPNVAQVMNLIGEVEGKIAIIVDDIVDTEGTLVAAVEVLHQKGATEIYCCCTHAILSDPAYDRIMASHLTEVVSTNTIKQPEKIMQSPKFVQVSVAPVLGQGILNIIDDKPVSDLFSYNKEENE